MAKRTTYTVTIGGHTFTRSSPRPYTHAVIGRADEAARRREIASYTETGSEEWKAHAGDHRWHVYVGAQTPGVVVTPPGWRFSKAFTEAEVEEAKRLADGGMAAYMARRQAAALERLEDAVAKGAYRMCALGWSMSEANAHKMAQQKRGEGYLDVRVVPVGAAVEG